MLHTKFQGHRSIGSGEEDFLRFLPYMGMAAILVMWPEPFEQFFVPLIPGGYIWNLVTIGRVVSEEKSFEIVDGRRRTTTTDDGACLYYKLPRSLRLRWAKNWWMDKWTNQKAIHPVQFFETGSIKIEHHDLLSYTVTLTLKIKSITGPILRIVISVEIENINKPRSLCPVSVKMAYP